MKQKHREWKKDVNLFGEVVREYEDLDGLAYSKTDEKEYNQLKKIVDDGDAAIMAARKTIDDQKKMNSSAIRALNKFVYGFKKDTGTIVREYLKKRTQAD